MVALALHAVLGGKPLASEDKQQRNEVKCSDRREALNNDELAAVKNGKTGTAPTFSREKNENTGALFFILEILALRSRLLSVALDTCEWGYTDFCRN